MSEFYMIRSARVEICEILEIPSTSKYDEIALEIKRIKQTDSEDVTRDTNESGWVSAKGWEPNRYSNYHIKTVDNEVYYGSYDGGEFEVAFMGTLFIKLSDVTHYMESPCANQP